MTLYLNFRSANVGGVVIDPRAWEGDGTAAPPQLKMVSDADLARRVPGKDLLFAAHGFNVNFENGARSLGRLEAALGLGPSEMFLGVLWPGDWWIPAINYPFEGATSIKCGDKLANYCNSKLGGARSLSFVSHSLGGRLILETVEKLKRPARVVCVTAGAINDDCLTHEYRAAAANGKATSTLASRKDTVLQIAFPAGDLIADLLNEDHAFGEPALGRSGPEQPVGSSVAPSQIPDSLNYNHGNYFPPPDPGPIAAGGQWRDVAAYIARAFRGERQVWP